MFRLRYRLALAGAAMLLAGVVLNIAHVDVDAASGSAGQGRVAVLERAAAATVPVVGRVKGWGELQFASGDHAWRAPLWAVVAAVGLVPLVGGLWWLSRPDRRVASSQRTAMLAASRAPPPLV